MERSKLVWIGVAVGSTVGGFIPSLWDSSMFGVAGIFGSAIGGFVGIYIAWKLSA